MGTRPTLIFSKVGGDDLRLDGFGGKRLELVERSGAPVFFALSLFEPFVSSEARLTADPGSHLDSREAFDAIPCTHWPMGIAVNGDDVDLVL